MYTIRDNRAANLPMEGTFRFYHSDGTMTIGYIPENRIVPETVSAVSENPIGNNSNHVSIPASVPTTNTDTITVYDGKSESLRTIDKYQLYAWTHKHEKNGKSIVLIAIDRKIDKESFKTLSHNLLERFSAHYSKYMKAYVIYSDDVPAFKKSGAKIHKKAPAFWKGSKT